MNKTRKIKENKNSPSKEESKGFQIDREKLSDWENWTDEFWKECSEALEDASSGLVDTMEQLLDDWDQWESFLEKALEYSWRWVQFLHTYFDEVLVDSDRWGLDFSDEGFQLYVAKWCDSGRIDASGCYTDYLDYPYQGNEFDDLLDIDPICNWAFTLVLHPELGSKCTSYDKFTGWSACCLLAVHPEFMNSFPLSEIGDPKSRFWTYASDPEQYESAWDALEKARPQFAKFRKAKTGIVVGETVAISLDGQRNWISCSQRVNGRSLKQDCFFANFKISYLSLKGAQLSDDTEERFYQISNAGGDLGDYGDYAEGSPLNDADYANWASKVKWKKVNPKVIAGADVATLSMMGAKKPCEYTVITDDALGSIAEIHVNGKFDPKKLLVETGRIYQPKSDDCDSDGCIQVVNRVMYDGEELEFYNKDDGSCAEEFKCRVCKGKVEE